MILFLCNAIPIMSSFLSDLQNTYTTFNHIPMITLAHIHTLNIPFIYQPSRQLCLLSFIFVESRSYHSGNKLHLFFFTGRFKAIYIGSYISGFYLRKWVKETTRYDSHIIRICTYIGLNLKGNWEGSI